MLDKASRGFLKYIEKQPEHTLEYWENEAFPPPGMDEDTAFALIRYLEDTGYVEVVKTTSQVSMAVRLSHKGLHRKEFGWQSVLQYIAEKWMELLALLVSAIALFRTF